MSVNSHDLLIVGGGIAGLALALKTAATRKVTLLRPFDDDRGASRWAQGGIAAVLSPQDSIADHVRDTLIAGDGLCDEAAVRFTVEHGSRAIEWLLELGVPFTADESDEATYPYHLTREGGHGARRVIHAADATGSAVIETLLSQVKAHPLITLEDQLTAIALIGDVRGQCRGAYCLDAQERVHELRAQDTVLATGGASGLYQHATSPYPACGEGMMMAFDIGAELANLEFQQFHPTCLYDPEGPPFLISEAVRGEGGVLRNLSGRRFMPDIDPRGELAPRDIVARAIDAQLRESGASHVLLDITHLPKREIEHLFPTIRQHCLDRGIDIARQPIPVVPAAHYSCGGIVIDFNGKTAVPHLHAIGEVSYTGLHGANRMASNSLLECLVFAHAAARRLRTVDPCIDSPIPPLRLACGSKAAPVQLANALERLRRIMTTRVGIVRDDAGLTQAVTELMTLENDCNQRWNACAPSAALMQLRRTIALGRLTIEAAMSRRESRGLHFNLDCPDHEAEPIPPLRFHLQTTGNTANT
ncbi:L-aspartate oxidase [Pistricoccus aurantiacus]|uniref:L-aspartate oxidase n=1 Tax=Pistricoccus aurantiacus TaxID=1883414 RepID=UPI00363517CE